MQPLTISPDFSVLIKIVDFIVNLYVVYLKDIIDPFLPMIHVTLNLFTAVFIAGIIIVLRKFTRLRKKEREFYAPIKVEEAETTAHKTQWEIILGHVNSENQGEWKIAIIEADNILDNILKEIGYEGDTLGERLKSAGDSDSVQQAWEAHKVRNEIAHEGGKELTKREAKRVISLYESVFKRFGYL
jgi:hypothetical protein